MIELMAKKDPWVSSTAGERLLFLLLSNHREWGVLSEALRAAELNVGRRFVSLSSFFVGASVLYLQQRLIRLAQDVRDEVPDRWEQATELRKRICDIIQLTPIEYKGDFGSFVEEVLSSAEQTYKEPSPALKRRVLHSGPNFCYSCGRHFGTVCADGLAPSGLLATVEHIWPRALGGDTIEENLLPACGSCNNSKGQIASWQMAWIQPMVFADADAQSGITGLTREVKIALHIRAAATYASNNGSSLREALIAIGPRESVVRIDVDQGYDFFNLRVHDVAATNVNWNPE